MPAGTLVAMLMKRSAKLIKQAARFGHLCDMEVYLAVVLRGNKETAFNAGSHTEIIRMVYEDYERLAEP